MTKMRYRFLGSGGIKVSELCLGTMMFGGATPQAEAERITAHAADAGVNFIDTADVYADPPPGGGGGEKSQPTPRMSMLRAARRKPPAPPLETGATTGCWPARLHSRWDPTSLTGGCRADISCAPSTPASNA